MSPKLWAGQGAKGKALILFYRMRFIPQRWRWNYFVWRVNRTEGPRWPYR